MAKKTRKFFSFSTYLWQNDADTWVDSTTLFLKYVNNQAYLSLDYIFGKIDSKLDFSKQTLSTELYRIEKSLSFKWTYFSNIFSNKIVLFLASFCSRWTRRKSFKVKSFVLFFCRPTKSDLVIKMVVVSIFTMYQISQDVEHKVMNLPRFYL